MVRRPVLALTSISLLCAATASANPSVTANDDAPVNTITSVGPPAPRVATRAAWSAPFIDNREKDFARRVVRETERFYEAREGLAAWVYSSADRTRGSALLNRVQRAHDDALIPEEYAAEALIARLASNEAPGDLALDAQVTATLLAYALDMSDGRYRPAPKSEPWFVNPPKSELGAELANATRTRAEHAWMSTLEPEFAEYRTLRELYHRYLEIAADGGYPKIAADLRLEPGESASAEQIEALAQRLEAEGLYRPNPLSTLFASDREDRTYSRALGFAVTQFQRRRGIDPTGTLDKQTVAALNEPIEIMLERIAANLDRWRWLPRTNANADRQVLVNIPQYEATVLRKGVATRTMRVIVGARRHPTPGFSTTARDLILNPFWRVPSSIAGNELIPKEKSNPGSLARQNFQVFDRSSGKILRPSEVDWSAEGAVDRYRLEQRPGGGNALGSLKIRLFDSGAVFMHDTSNPRAFERDYRALSHGCIRLSEPTTMAAEVLARSADEVPQQAQRIQDILDSKKLENIEWEDEVPVHVLYLTVRPDPTTGSVVVYRDIYQRDRWLRKKVRRTDALLGQRPVESDAVLSVKPDPEQAKSS